MSLTQLASVDETFLSFLMSKLGALNYEGLESDGLFPRDSLGLIGYYLDVKISLLRPTEWGEVRGLAEEYFSSRGFGYVTLGTSIANGYLTCLGCIWIITVTETAESLWLAISKAG